MSDNPLNEKKYSVLDHGFIRIIETMGEDYSITQAARISYGSGSKGKDQDERLLRYLMRNQHTSPFEMCEIKLHVKAPIFVARQWLRHRTASVNEYSLRYSLLQDDYYLPPRDQLRSQSEDNKQGRGELLSEEKAQKAEAILKETTELCLQKYRELIDEGEGLAKELARIILPVNVYTEFYWKIDLHNLLHFIRLRIDAHAQYEIREYAQVLLDIVKEWLPVTYKAFCDYHLNASSHK